MYFKKVILFFGLTEISIGTITLTSVFQALLLHESRKPLNVLIFVIVSCLISIYLGAGILLREKYSRKLLIFFAGWIILSKILIFAKIITLNGALETTMPLSLKNFISIFYHSVVILYFHHPVIKAEFGQ